MNESIVSTYFGKDHAIGYDERWTKSAPMRDILHFLMRMVLLDLPKEARVLCVGVGTGSELIALARAFPGWRFMAVEPSAPMLEICREKVEKEGITPRCEFHEGYLASFPHADPFDAATAILVSQFLTSQDDRRKFFNQIAQRLRPGGYLISADLAASIHSPAFERMFEVWLRAITGQSSEPAKPPSSFGWGKDVAVSAPHEVESIIIAGGFEPPTLFYQSLFIHAWYSRLPL